MKKKEFMSILEKELNVIRDASERENALRFYSEYFMDAGIGDDDVIPDELNNVHSIAKEIIDGVINNSDITNSKLNELIIDVINANVYIIPSDKIEVVIEASPNDNSISYNITDEKIVIEQVKTNPIHIFGFAKIKQAQIKIYIKRESFIENIKAETVNGGIKASELQFNNGSFESVNGGIFLENVESKNLHCKVVNGAIYVSGNLNGKNEFETVNGSINCNLVLKKENYDILLQNIHGAINVDSESFRKEYSSRSEASNTIRAESVNGSINLHFN